MAKRDTRLDAIKYQEMLKQQQAKKRASEDQAKEEVDKLSKLVASIRQMGSPGAEAEGELDKANAALRDKNWTAAFNAAQSGLVAGHNAAAAAARAQVSAAEGKAVEVENVGVVSEELNQLIQEARSILDDGRYVEAMRKAQELRAKAMALGRAQMEDAIATWAHLLEDDRRKGVDTRSPEAILDRARNLLAGGDVNFQQVANLVTDQLPAAQGQAARGEGPSEDRPAPPAPVDEEDLVAMRRAVEESFQLAAQEIKTARQLKANVAAAEKELTRAKSALDSNDLKTARASSRRSIVAAMAAARKSVHAILQDAAAEVRRLRLAGANVTEPRKILATAKARAAEGSFAEAADLVQQLLKRTAETREQQQRLVKDVEQAMDALVGLTAAQVAPSDAIEALEEARNYARRGDVDRAQAALKRATTVGRDFWNGVVGTFIRDVRDLILESKESGGQVGTARTRFNTAKQQLDEGKFQEAIDTALSAATNLDGVAPPYHEALKLAAAKFLDFEIALKLGLASASDADPLHESAALRAVTKDGQEKGGEAYVRDLEKHAELLEPLSWEFKAEMDRFQRLARRTLELENEVEEGKKIGTDMTNAEELLFNARGQIQKRKFPAAEESLKQITADITARKDARIEELLRDADTDLKHLRAGGVYVEDVEREVREARAQHAQHNYEVAVDLIQDAISTALERQQDLEAARREVTKAESLIEQGEVYAADMGVAIALLDEARSLSREHDDRDARAIAGQAVSEAQTSLSKFIDLILEEAGREIDRAESEYGDFPEPKQRLQEAKRLHDQSETGEALVLAREITEGLRQSVQTIQEIRQKIDLVQSYITWTGQYSKTVVMPHKLLEHAKERLEHFSLEAAREAVNEALQKAEDAQRQFIRQVHREAFELIDEYEDKGVQLTAARNLMMQAQGLLETKNFQESYKSAVKAQDLARKSFDIFQRTQRAVGELETEVNTLQALSVDTAALTGLLEKASAAFASEDYDTANTAVTQAQELAPLLKAQKAEALEKEVAGLLEVAKGRLGLNLKRFTEAFDHCKQTKAGGDVGLAVEMLSETKRDLESALKESEAIELLLTSLDGRLAEFGKIGLSSTTLATAKSQALKRLDASDLKEGTSTLKRALRQADRDAAGFCASKIDALLSEALALRLRGYPTEGVIQAAEAGSEALLSGDFGGAISTAAAAAEALKALPPRVDAVRRNVSRGRLIGRLLKDAFGQDVGHLEELDDIERGLDAGGIEAAEGAAQSAVNGLVESIRGPAALRLDKVEASLAEAESKGAATAAVAEAVRLGRTALDQGLPEAAVHWARVGASESVQAVEEARLAKEALAKAEGLLNDAAAFGAPTHEIEAKVEEIRASLKERRHRTALTQYRAAESAWHGAKKGRVDARKSEVLQALQKAAKLGLPQDAPRRAIAQAERLMAEEQFDAALKAIDDLEAETATSIARHDELAREFEALADLMDSFSDLKIDFKSAVESRDHARGAIERFQLKEAEELTALFRKEVDGILTAHCLSKIQSLVRAAAGAKAEGMVILEMEEHAKAAEEELNKERYREALVTVDRGMDKLGQQRKRFAEVQKLVKDADTMLARATPLGLDLAEPAQALKGVRGRVAAGEYEEAKLEADYVLENLRAKIASDVERRVEELTTRIEEAASLGVSIESERASLKRAREAAEASDFAKLLEAEKAVEGSIERKLEERTVAIAELDRAHAHIDQLSALDIPESEFTAEVAAVEKLVSANQFARALPLAQALAKKLGDRMRTRVDTAIGETGSVLRVFNKSGIDSGSSGDELERARKLTASGGFHEAYQVARAAEITAYEAKDKHDHAKQTIKFFDDNFVLARAGSLDVSDLETLHMQALDAFEFQSYEEATATALEALGKLNRRLKEAFEARLGQTAGRAEELEMAGASVGILRQELDLASSLVGHDDYFSANVSLGGTEKRIELLAAEFAGAKEAADALSALIDVADVLKVEAKRAQAALAAAQGSFEQGKYPEARQGAFAARNDLALGCALEVQKRIDAGGDVLSKLEADGVPTGALPDTLLRSMEELLAQDYVGAFGTAREVSDGADQQRRAHEATRHAIHAARWMLRVAEGLDADAAAGREMLSEAELLLLSGDFTGSAAAAGQSHATLSSATADSAGLLITQAEQDLGQFGESGVRCLPAEDSLKRSREALDLSDYLGSIRFARMSTRLAEQARSQMAETEKVLEEYRSALERAEGLMEVSGADRAAGDAAMHDFESGQMLRAAKALRTARALLDGRARERFAAVKAQVQVVASGLSKMQGDPAPTLDELKEAEKALSEGRALDALEGLISTRSFARDSFSELIAARAGESEALIDQVESGGTKVAGAREALESLRKTADDLEVDAAVQQAQRLRLAVEAAVKMRAEAVAGAAQKAADHRFFRTGRGAQEAAQWKTAANELRALSARGDLAKVMAGAAALDEKMSGGIAAELAEKLVEIDAMRDAQLKRREAVPEEQALYERVVAAADAGKAQAGDLQAADKLDQAMRDWASKFVADSVTRIKREMMTFEDKAAVEHLQGLVAAVEKVKGNAAVSLAKTYELLDGARDLMSARATGLLALADRQLTIARAIDLDAAALQDFVERAHAAMADGDVSQAIEFAENILKESARLQEAHVGELLKKVMAEFQTAAEGKAKGEAKRLLEETRSAFRTKDFEAAYDFSKRARELLVAEAREAAEGEIRGLLETVAQLEGEGVDCTPFRDAVEGIRDAFERMDSAAARKGLADTSSLIKQRHAEWQQAAASLAKLQERIDRATAAKIELGDIPKRFADCKQRLRDAEFSAVVKETAAVSGKLNELLATKVKAMIQSAQAKVKHNKNLEIDNRSAEEMLASAQKLLAAKDVEGAFDAATRAIAEADSAKEVTKQLRTLGDQGTELLERAAEAGISLSPDQEQIIFDAAKGRLKPGMKVAALESLIQSIREQVGAGGPRLDMRFTVADPPVVNRTNNVVLEITNQGDAPAEDLTISFSGEANVKLLGGQPGTLEPGDHRDLDLQVISRKMGKSPVRVLLTYKDPAGGGTRRRTDRRWVTFFDPTDTASEDQFVRRGEKCLVCVGEIGTSETMKVCECQSTFHLHCAAGITECPKCGRNLADS